MKARKRCSAVQHTLDSGAGDVFVVGKKTRITIDTVGQSSRAVKQPGSKRWLNSVNELVPGLGTATSVLVNRALEALSAPVNSTWYKLSFSNHPELSKIKLLCFLLLTCGLDITLSIVVRPHAIENVQQTNGCALP